MNHLQFLLLKLSEECNEIAQMASKSMQFGLLERHPELDENNKQRLHAELNDLHGVIALLNAHYDFQYKPDDQAINKKIGKIQKYLTYSINLGCVFPEVPADQWTLVDPQKEST